MSKAFVLSMLVVFIVILIGVTGCAGGPVKPCKGKLPEELTEQEKQECKEEAARKTVRNHYDAVFPGMYIPILDPSTFSR